MIPQKVIEEIRDRTDIIQVIGSAIDLKKSGRNFKALCPFHAEKTPSFMVSPEKQIYHCFGCGKGGNVFHFLMDYEGVGFVEAVRKFGKELGIDVERYLVRGETREKLEPYYHAMDFAVTYYSTMLKEGRGSEQVRQYLKGREIDEELIEQFKLGFALPGWDNFYRTASDAGVSRDILRELNLVMRSRGGSGYRDYFRNRVIFPIATLSHRVVGLAGRVLDQSEPKYLNTTESPIYSKGRIFYGLNQSKDHIRKSGFAVIVEGYMDYLMLWKRGICNVCAVCGTSLTEDQTRLLARYTNRVYIINDGDRAGIRAAVRAADQLLAEGFEILVVILPEGEDPDSFVRRRGAEALQEMMHSAPNYFSYLREEAERGTRTTYRKDQVIKHLLGSVSRVGDEVKKELYLQEISSLFDMPMHSLRAGLRREKVPSKAAALVEKGESRRQKYQKLLFRLGFESDRYARDIVEHLNEEDLEGPLFRSYYKALDLALKKHIDITSQDFIGTIEDSELCKLASEIALMQPPPGPAGEFIVDTVAWLKRLSLRDELNMLKKQLQELRSEPGSDEEKVEIAEAYRKISRELKKMGLKEGKQANGSR